MSFAGLADGVGAGAGCTGSGEDGADAEVAADDVVTGAEFELRASRAEQLPENTAMAPSDSATAIRAKPHSGPAPCPTRTRCLSASGKVGS